MEPRNTPLYDEHIKNKAMMTPFAGWSMPIHYGSIIGETKHTRSLCSIFDICHMGELIIKEDPSNSTLDKIVTVPVVKMKIKRCKYGFLLNEKGGIIDDLIIYRLAEDEWMIVVNASNAETDALTISSMLSPSAKFEDKSDSTAKLDIQGPNSVLAMEKIAGKKIRDLKYFGFDFFNVLGEKCVISRTGYTGELGYELYIGASKASEAWKTILKNDNVKPAGLGARDILRLEAGLPLHGADLTPQTTPFEAGFEKMIDFDKDFTGKEALLKQKEAGVNKKLTGIAAEGRRAPRHNNNILINGKITGTVTSGTFSPRLNKGIGMGYIESGFAGEGTGIEIDTGRANIKAKTEKMPFVKETSLRSV